MEYGDILFKKEFYASAICDQENGTNMRLRKFARAWLAVSGDDEEGDVELEEGVHGEDEPRVGHHVILHLVVVCKIATTKTQSNDYFSTESVRLVNLNIPGSGS